MSLNPEKLLCYLQEYKDISFFKFVDILPKCLENDIFIGIVHTHKNQVVFKTNSFYYKIYVYTAKSKFNSLVRKELAAIYTSYGLHWNVTTIFYDGMYIDIEERTQLKTIPTYVFNCSKDIIVKEIHNQLYKIIKKLELDTVINTINTKYNYDINGIILTLADKLKEQDIGAYNGRA